MKKHFDLSFQAKPISQFLFQKPIQIPSIVLTGFASDQGTARNGGRKGGQRCISMVRYLLKQDIKITNKPIIADIGDTISDQYNNLQQVLQAHRLKLIQAMKKYPQAHYVSIGGSNDQSYQNISAFMEVFDSNIAVINIDAHFDVRPKKQGKAHSGSPFWQLLQDKRFKGKFIQFGVKGFCCSQKHTQYLIEKNAQIVWMQKNIRRAKPIKGMTQAGSCFKQIIQSVKNYKYVFMSFDVDSIDARFMPGVSAPNVTGGLSLNQAKQIVDIASNNPSTRLFDFSEGNPAVQKSKSMHLIGQLFKIIVQNKS